MSPGVVLGTFGLKVLVRERTGPPHREGLLAAFLAPTHPQLSTVWNRGPSLQA